MDREVPYEEHICCDMCGEAGAFDFMGDFLCQRCAKKFVSPHDETDGDDETEEDE